MLCMFVFISTGRRNSSTSTETIIVAVIVPFVIIVLAITVIVIVVLLFKFKRKPDMKKNMHKELHLSKVEAILLNQSDATDTASEDTQMPLEQCAYIKQITVVYT